MTERVSRFDSADVQTPVVRFDDENATIPAGEKVQRYDFAELEKPERTRAGFLRVQGFLLKPGVFEYRQADGTVQKEYRAPEEVFRQDTIDSLELAPLTLEHPPELLTPKTAKSYAVGSVGRPERTADKLRADFLITDERAIAAAESGKRGVSPGMDMMLIRRSGTVTHADGRVERFDALQTQILGNHVALTSTPRMGAEIAIRMDAKEIKTVKVKIDGIEHDVPEQVAQRLDALEKESTAKTSELEIEKGKVIALEAARTDSTEADKRAKEIADHIERVARVVPILGKTVAEVVRMDAREIERAVVQKEAPEIKLDGLSADTIHGVYLTVMAKRKDSAAELNKILGGSAEADAKRMDSVDLTKVNEAARAKMIEDQKGAWKQKSA